MKHASFRLCLTQLKTGGIILLAGLLSPSIVKAATMSADTIYASTITGQATSNGIIISSYVYITSGSSLTLQGAGGYITDGSSITASAFFGDGSHLTGSLGFPTSTQTFSGANTFTSSFTVQSGGRQIILSTSTSVNTINISSTGVISFYPSLHNSSITIIPFYQTTNKSLGPCVPGSTLTITTNGGMVEVGYAGNFSDLSQGTARYMNFLQDGQYVRDLSNQKAVSFFIVGGVLLGAQSFSYLIDTPPPTAGPHSYCLSIAANPVTMDTVAIGRDSSNSEKCTSLFYIKELK